MDRKFCTTAFLLLFISGISLAQNKKTGLVKGKLFNSVTKKPFQDLKISITDINVFATSDGEGNFLISEVPYGSQTIVISAYNAKTKTISAVIDKDVVDLGDITVTPDSSGVSELRSEIPTIAIEDNSNTSSEDDGVTNQNTGEAVDGGRDPFLGSVYSLIPLNNFHYRGYQTNPHEFNINGISINDVETNSASFNQFGKLYDVFHVRDLAYGLAPSDYSFGGRNGTEYMDATAADKYAGTRISYTFTDRNYNNGFEITHNSGLSKKGWAFSLSFAKRWADAGYVPGTFYNDYAYYGALSKKIGKGMLNLTTVGSPIDHGKSASATQEAYTLDGSNYYNHNWGYYDGQVRNARVEKEFRPLTILNYEIKPSDATRWNIAAGYEVGKDKNSFVDYYNASSPYGDYYKNMPSYWYTMVPPDSTVGNAVKNQILSNPAQALQLNWNRMYQDNYSNTQTMYNINGVPGTSYTGKQSEYVLSNAVANLKKFVFNTNVEHSVDEHMTLTGGLNVTSQHTENYNQLADLLGGDYFVNYNNFASQQYVSSPNYNQNNLRQPNAVIKVGDKYGSDYAIHINDALLWGQAVYNFDKFSFFVAANVGDNSFYRDGFFQNGLFPENSYGVSPTENFFDFAVKGGVSYKIDSRNNLFVNALYSTTPPTSDNTYISAATRDYTVNDPAVQKNQVLEAGYTLKSSRLFAHVVAYASQVEDATEIKRFYDDDPAFNTFVNYVMTGENTRSIGTEISLRYQLIGPVFLVGTASVGQSYYSNNPNIAVYLDNDPSTTATQSTTYIKNYYVSAGPQSTYIGGFEYRPRRDFYVKLSGNYFDRNYVEINPNRRTTAAGGYYAVGSPQWNAIMNQQKLPSAFTMDLRASKNFQLSRMSKAVSKFSKRSFITISASIANLLNNRDVINYGYEQLRFDFENYNPDKFANKYVYGMGINFSLNASLRF